MSLPQPDSPGTVTLRPGPVLLNGQWNRISRVTRGGRRTTNGERKNKHLRISVCGDQQEYRINIYPESPTAKLIVRTSGPTTSRIRTPLDRVSRGIVMSSPCHGSSGHPSNDEMSRSPTDRKQVVADHGGRAEHRPGQALLFASSPALHKFGCRCAVIDQAAADHPHRFRTGPRILDHRITLRDGPNRFQPPLGCSGGPHQDGLLKSGVDSYAVVGRDAVGTEGVTDGRVAPRRISVMNECSRASPSPNRDWAVGGHRGPEAGACG